MKTTLCTLILAVCALAQPQPKATVSEILSIKAENIELRMTLLQSEAQRLQSDSEALRRQACAEAKLSDACIVNWRTKTAMERPAPKPVADKKERK